MAQPRPLIIENDGPRIVRTNYWQSPYHTAALFYLTLNAGAFRLLVPQQREGTLREMRTASHVVISRGRTSAGPLDALELLFDDGSEAPFSMQLDVRACDRLPARTDEGGRFVFSAWTHRVGETATQRLRLPCGYRRVPRLPDLRAWDGVPLTLDEEPSDEN